MSEAAMCTYYCENTAILRDAKMEFYQARSSENKAHQIQDYSDGIKSFQFTASRPDWETQWLAGLS